MRRFLISVKWSQRSCMILRAFQMGPLLHQALLFWDIQEVLLVFYFFIPCLIKINEIISLFKTSYWEVLSVCSHYYIIILLQHAVMLSVWIITIFHLLHFNLPVYNYMWGIFPSEMKMLKDYFQTCFLKAGNYISGLWILRPATC